MSKRNNRKGNANTPKSKNTTILVPQAPKVDNPSVSNPKPQGRVEKAINRLYLAYKADKVLEWLHSVLESFI